MNQFLLEDLFIRLLDENSVPCGIGARNPQLCARLSEKNRMGGAAFQPQTNVSACMALSFKRITLFLDNEAA